jgi:hypothetical protein
MEPIKNLDYAQVSSRKGFKGSGLDLGQEVLVIATKALPEKKSDPYAQRIYVVVVLIKDGLHQIPNNKTGKDDNGYRSYLVDPRHLTRLSDSRSDELREMLDEQYTLPAEEDTTPN